MMDLVNRVNIVLILLVIKEIIGYDEAQDLSDALINDLYKKYKEAINRDGDLVILRRQLDQNQLFEIHVKKLKEVNGYKLHNLMIKGKVRSGSPFIYINNPVESKMPNAYLTLEEFKEALTKRVQKHKQTTLSFIDVFFTTKKCRKHSHKSSHSTTILKNVTKVFKVTSLIRSSIKSTLLEKKFASNSITSTKPTTQENIFESTSISNSSTATMKPPENYSATEETTKSTLQMTNLTTVTIEDLNFLRTSPMNYNYTEIENYSNMSVSTDKYDNNTPQAINMTTAIIETLKNDTEHTNTSYPQTEENKLNKKVLTLVSSIPINMTKLQEISSVDTVMSFSNKTNDNQIGITENMITDNDITTVKRKETFNQKNVTILESPDIATTSLLIVSPAINTTSVESNKSDIDMPLLYNNTYLMNNTATEVLSTNYIQKFQNKSDAIYNTTTDVSEKTTESVNLLTKKFTPEISNTNYTENTNLETHITADREINHIAVTQKESFINTTELNVSKSSNVLTITPTNASTISESSKRVPKRKVTSEASTLRTPWRRRTRKGSTTKSMTKIKRSTLGRPLVFIGGP